MTGPDDLRASIEETLALLDAYTGPGAAGAGDAALPSLLAQCRDRVAANAAAGPQPVALLHHFACTGGTLISRAIAAQPNVVLLSEVDPFSTLPLSWPRYAPTDIIMLAQTGLRKLPARVIGDIFMAGLTTLHRHLQAEGRRLVLRDHAHSQFCTEADPAARPLLSDLVGGAFETRRAVSVRHPLDSHLSLRVQGWLHFRPATLEEYARRYGLFLDAHAGVPLLRYEDFLAAPEAETEALAGTLDLPVNPGWPDLMSVTKLSGDSGRKGAAIAPRPRRPLPEGAAAEAAASPAYAALCARLGYDPDPAAPADPVAPAQGHPATGGRK